MISLLYKFNIINDKGVLSRLDLTKEQLFKNIPSLNERDMHIIDEQMQFKISSFSSKNGIILIKLDNIRAIIMSDSAMFPIDTCKPDNRDDPFLNNLSRKIQSNTKLPFELKILEEIFIHISDIYDQELDTLTPNVNRVINVLGSQNINNINERDIKDSQIKLIGFHYKVKDIYDLIKDLSKWDEDDYYDLYLDDNKKGSINDDEEEIIIQQIGDIINTYLHHFEEHMDILDNMNKSIDTLLKIIDIKISNSRNKMSKITINLTILMLSVSLANLLSSIYGMNVPNFLETSNGAFPIICIIIVIIIIIVYFVSMKLITNLI